MIKIKMTKPPKINLEFLVALLYLTLIGNTSVYAQKADIILTRGKIFTSDSSQLYVQALAIKNNRILAVGSSHDIEKLVSNKTRLIDLKGKTVLPGFNDAYDHLGWLISYFAFYNY